MMTTFLLALSECNALLSNLECCYDWVWQGLMNFAYDTMLKISPGIALFCFDFRRLALRWRLHRRFG